MGSKVHLQTVAKETPGVLCRQRQCGWVGKIKLQRNQGQVGATGTSSCRGWGGGGASAVERPKDLTGKMSKYNKYEVRAELARA